jgi:hypothetical protein
MNVQLDYSLTTRPFPLQASAASGNLSACMLTVTASNPAAAPDENPVTVQGVQVTLPTGEGGSALTTDPTDIQPAGPPGWTLQTGTDPNVFAWLPPSGSAVVTGDSLVFTLGNVYVNRQPGDVEGLQVAEGQGGCAPPDCPTTNLTLIKFPYGWGAVDFWVDPPVISAGDSTTLNWSGPQGATYEIEYGTRSGVVNIPPIGGPPLASQGTYPGQGQPPLAPGTTTVFTLNVSETSSGNYTAQDQKTVTVQEGPPTIASFNGQVAYTGSGTYELTFSWTTDSSTGYCLIPQAGSDELAPDSPPQGDTLQVKSPHSGTFDLEAHNDAGSTTATLTLDWAITAEIPGIGWDPMPHAALSPDGTRLYVTSAAGLVVYALPDDPTAAPTQLGSWTFRDDGLDAFAVTAVAAGAQDLVWVLVAPVVGMPLGTSLQFTPMLISPQGALVGSPTPTSVDRGDGSGPYYLGAAPGGSPLYLADGQGRGPGLPGPRLSVYNLGSQYSPTLASSTSTGGSAVGVAVAADGSVYTSDLDNAYRYTPTAGGLTLTAKQPLGNWHQGTGLSDVAVAGDTLFVGRARDLLVLDRISLQPVRPALGVTGATLAAAASGLRLFAYQPPTEPGTETGPEAILAPSTLTGGTS